MNKTSQLFNESTVVNFGLLWRLALRYRMHSVIALILLSCIYSFNYYAQPVIYSITAPIKSISNHAVSKDLTALIPSENTSSLTLNELKISMSNFSFLQSYAGLVVSDPVFDNLNFGSVKSTVSLFGRELKKMCAQDNKCLVTRLTNLLRETFNVEQGLTEDRYVLTVNAIENKTVQSLSTILLKALELDRRHARQYLVTKEIQSVDNLISESRSFMKKMDGFKSLEEQEKLLNNISDLKDRIKMIQQTSNTETANFTSLESKLAENRKSTTSKGQANQNDLEKIKKAQLRLVEIKQNLSILTTTPESNRSIADGQMIELLKEEEFKTQKLLPKDHHRRKIELSESFIEVQRGKLGDYEFDYQVSKNKVKKLNEEYELLKVELNTSLQQKNLNEQKVISTKADLEFLKNLESKQMSLKLLNATMTSDLYFEDVSLNVREFRQSTNLKLFLFSLSISGLFYLVTILIRFFTDDIIYGVDEIQSHFDKLDFIGAVPKFDA